MRGWKGELPRHYRIFDIPHASSIFSENSRVGPQEQANNAFSEYKGVRVAKPPSTREYLKILQKNRNILMNV